MPEKEQIFKGSIKYVGVFSFKDFYKFCYDWLTEETGLDVVEDKYAEKLAGDSKEIDVVWIGTKKITDYFKFYAKVKFEIRNLKEVEVVRGSNKIKMNNGSVKIVATGTLIRDYEGKFERGPTRKFLRSVYEKWVIPSRVEQMEDKIIEALNKFLEQGKAYLDLEGRK